MKAGLIFLSSGLLSICTLAQTPEISGTVLDENNDPIIGATIVLYRQNRVVDKAVSDFDGIYTFKLLTEGCCYEVYTSHLGYKPDSLIMIVASHKTRIDSKISRWFPPNTTSPSVRIYKRPIIEPSGVCRWPFPSLDNVEQAPVKDSVTSIQIRVARNPEEILHREVIIMGHCIPGISPLFLNPRNPGSETILLAEDLEKMPR